MKKLFVFLTFSTILFRCHIQRRPPTHSVVIQSVAWNLGTPVRLPFSDTLPHHYHSNNIPRHLIPFRFIPFRPVAERPALSSFHPILQ
jgi:hypothetical protein